MRMIVPLLATLLSASIAFAQSPLTAEATCAKMVEWKKLGDKASVYQRFREAYDAYLFKSPEQVEQKCRKLIRKGVFDNSSANFQAEALDVCVGRASISVVFACLPAIKEHSYTDAAIGICAMKNQPFTWSMTPLEWSDSLLCLRLLRDKGVSSEIAHNCAEQRQEGEGFASWVSCIARAAHDK